MFHVDENTNKISITRGDSGYFEVDVLDECSGEPYEIQPTDIVRFTVKKSTKDGEPTLIQKSNEGNASFHLVPEDTNGLAFSTYKYDVEITQANGDVWTVITPSAFEVTAEVTT